MHADCSYILIAKFTLIDFSFQCFIFNLFRENNILINIFKMLISINNY